ncbi:hypothetical protein OI25_599 [Paraburkholderia fungorum]|uniref:Uncharacterized protein n=1 Tax=Paraburkholderia fungorum TaxID=134537 RepID=A0AAU8T1A9_9BURK|nr:hypothetical protein [Paraburkholderia fungorum]AJZ60136.1 hypothetical protein OI25_599 [Paraburkholderia fungorum]
MRAPAHEFASLVDQRIAALSREHFYLRTGHAKHLLEELYPISRFGLYCLVPGVMVEVEAFEDNRAMDAVIRIGNDEVRTLHLEVTYVDSYEEALRREMLWIQGSAPGTGGIARNKGSGEIVAEYSPVSLDESADQLGGKIVALFQKKVAKKYRSHTILLIAFDDPTFFGQADWQRLFASIKRYGGLCGGGFEEVHLFNSGSNDLVTHVHILD